MTNKRLRVCSLCGKHFEGYPGKQRGKNTYCGKECRLKAMSVRNKTTQRVNKPGGLTFEERTKIRESKLGNGKVNRIQNITVDMNTES